MPRAAAWWTSRSITGCIHRQTTASAVAQTRALDEVDPNRVALWFFSGGGLLSADWFAQPPPWLHCIAATYPLLAPLPGWEVDARFCPVEAVRTAGSVRILLTRVGRERPEIAATAEAFTASAERHQVAVDVIDVPDGQHSFDMLDHTDSSRTAVTDDPGHSSACALRRRLYRRCLGVSALASCMWRCVGYYGGAPAYAGPGW